MRYAQGRIKASFTLNNLFLEKKTQQTTTPEGTIRLGRKSSMSALIALEVSLFCTVNFLQKLDFLNQQKLQWRQEWILRFWSQFSLCSSISHATLHLRASWPWAFKSSSCKVTSENSVTQPTDSFCLLLSYTFCNFETCVMALHWKLLQRCKKKTRK